MSDSRKYFLPYQAAWLADTSPVKIWEKSRRVGATYVQSYEDVSDCATKRVPAVWFSSADQSAAREYIEYCSMWATLLEIAAESLGEEVIDDEKGITAFTIRFTNGTRIHALSSNPSAFRSKGGKVVLDEFAHHEQADKMWKAARPVVTWGYPLRILSTHNGMSSRFNRFIKAIRAGRLRWSLHATTIVDAVNDGLVDKILGRPATAEEREAWLRQQETDVADAATWAQEYMCVAEDEAEAFLTYDLIGACEKAEYLLDFDAIVNLATPNNLFVGMDIARRKDLSVIWVLEQMGSVLYTRHVKVMEKTRFKIQREALFAILKHPRMRRCCIDQTGIGMQLAEESLEAFGQYRVEPVTFTGAVKEALAYPVKRKFEDRTIVIPDDTKIREDFHSVRKLTTAAGNVRFDVAGDENLDSHADRFWSCALAVHAAEENPGPVRVAARGPRESHTWLEGFDTTLEGYE